MYGTQLCDEIVCLLDQALADGRTSHENGTSGYQPSDPADISLTPPHRGPRS